MYIPALISKTLLFHAMEVSIKNLIVMYNITGNGPYACMHTRLINFNCLYIISNTGQRLYPSCALTLLGILHKVLSRLAPLRKIIMRMHAYLVIRHIPMPFYVRKLLH